MCSFGPELITRHLHFSASWRISASTQNVVGILDLFFPRRCLGCGSIGKYFCNGCRSTTQTIGQNETICPICEKPSISGVTHARCKTFYTIDGLTSFFRYDGIIRQAVKALKYRFVSDLASEFVSLVPTKLLIAKPRCSLVPIPLHPARLRYRGFNQAELLGRLIAKKLSLPMTTNVLTRVRSTKPQVEMKDRRKRLENMEKVFRVLPSTMNHIPSAVFLFDDVFTTGATMRAAASVLKKAGTRFVWGMTMAR